MKIMVMELTGIVRGRARQWHGSWDIKGCVRSGANTCLLEVVMIAEGNRKRTEKVRPLASLWVNASGRSLDRPFGA